MIFLKISLNTDDMLAKMSDTNILYIDDIVGNQTWFVYGGKSKDFVMWTIKKISIPSYFILFYLFISILLWRANAISN